MADTIYPTLELKNIRMDGFLFSFLGKYRHNAIFCDRIWPKLTDEFSSQWHFKIADDSRKPGLAIAGLYTVSGRKQTAPLETTQWLAFEQSHLAFSNDFI